MLVNISDQSATRRLLQCRDMGVSVNDISMKFMRPPEYATDLHEVDFLVRMKVVIEVQKWIQRMRGRHKWVPILYHYEVILGVLSEPVVVSAIFANLYRTDCGQLCQTQRKCQTYACIRGRLNSLCSCDYSLTGVISSSQT